MSERLGWLDRIQVLELYEAIKHGDEEHQAWLLEAIECWNHGRPVPPPRSKSDAISGGKTDGA